MEQCHTDRVRLGEFELHLKTGELYPIATTDKGDKILLREQPFQVLRMLVERQGEIVTREEIRRKLWPNSTIVDFDHSINAAISALRRALGDSASNPKYIETLARRGYRLVVPTQWLETTTEDTTVDAIVAKPQLRLDSLIGKKVSHFRVLEVIGGGGMGIVYKAEDLKLGRRVALKFLPEEMAENPVALKRFELEAQTASALNHPNICTIYSVEEYEGQPFIAMELLEGETLQNRIAASEPKTIPLTQLLDIAIQISEGLQAAHDKNFIHRDIKPANLFLTAQGTVKILDFGLAKLAASEGVMQREPEDRPSNIQALPHHEYLAADNGVGPDRISPGLTRTGTNAGTIGYMSPEQVRREKLDTRTDLFSFGLVLYEVAAGRQAFVGQTLTEVHDAILNQTPTALQDVKSSVPRGLDGVIKKALEKEPARRYQSASEMRRDLERVKKEIHPARRLTRRLIVATALILVLATGFWFYQGYRNRSTLSDTDAIVIADIDNQTGDPVFDDALNAALRHGLEQTPYLNVLASDKVIRTLGLLNLPPTTKVTAEVAGQICQRTNSRLVIASSVADAGNRFRIELTAIDSQSGTTVARVREDAASRNEVVHVLGDVAAQLRGKLGEPAMSLARFNKPLELATSSSLDALQAGMMGYRRHIAGDYRGASTNYQHAIELDPDFALIYNALGSANESLYEIPAAQAATKKAYELRDRMTESNRLRAEYLYYLNVTGELEKAYLAGSQAVQTFPRDVLARNNLAVCLKKLGQPNRAADEAREAARLVPSPFSYYQSVSFSISANRLNEAKAIFDDADARKFDNSRLRERRALLAFLQRDDRALQEQWKWAEGKPDAYLLLKSKASIEFFHGRIRQGRLLGQQAADQAADAILKAHFKMYDALREAELGNVSPGQLLAKEALTNIPNRDVQLTFALACARAGATEPAKKLADAFDRDFPLDTVIQNYYLPTIRAAIKLDENDPPGAIEILQPALKYDLANPDSFNGLYPAYIRGLAYLQLGDGRQAAAEFKKVLDHRGIVGRDIQGVLSHLQLARAQKLMGDQAAARKSYEEFLTLWKDADVDIPIYKQAKAEYSSLGKP